MNNDKFIKNKLILKRRFIRSKYDIQSGTAYFVFSETKNYLKEHAGHEITNPPRLICSKNTLGYQDLRCEKAIDLYQNGFEGLIVNTCH